MNANLCSAAIWPEMGESAALTTGSEAESISAHFLDHLVPHPKRGKYGLYHSPTLSFLSLHCWLRAVSTRTGRLGRVCTQACCGAAWEGSLLGPHLTRPRICALVGCEQLWRGARDPGPKAGGRGCRSIPGSLEGDWSASEPSPRLREAYPFPSPSPGNSGAPSTQVGEAEGRAG